MKLQSGWGKEDNKTGVFELKFSKTTGRLLEEGKGFVIDVDSVRIVLNRAKDTLEGYRVRTAFPIKKVIK